MKILKSFFLAVRAFSQKFGVTQHSIRLYAHNTFFPSDESNPRAKQIKNIHSFNCFIQPASPWIIYIAPQRYVSTLSYLLRTLLLLECLALFHSSNLSLHPSTFSLVYLSSCYLLLLLDIYIYILVQLYYFTERNHCKTILLTIN